MKKLIIPFLSIITLPTSIQANIDPKITEICMKATDFQGCVKSMSVKKTNNLNINPNFDNTLTLFKNGDYFKASKAINTFLIPYFLIASEQGGVLPVVEQGSRVTYISEFSSADSAFEPRFLNLSLIHI